MALNRVTAIRTAAIGCAAMWLAGAAPDNAERPSAVWTDLRDALYDQAAVAEGAGVIAMDAPYRADDPAAVPIAIRVTPPADRRVTGLTLIVDENPAPVAAEFTFHEAMGAAIALTTRVRVNMYSNVRAVAELDDGSLFQIARFVKATGGCAAPATTDAAAALATLGRMKVRRFDGPQSRPAGVGEAQVMIRHPNNSGFQLDQVSQLYIPAFFIDRIEVAQGDVPLFSVTGGISLSEDPSIRFEYLDNGEAISVSAGDTDGGVYQGAFPPPGGS